MQKRSILSRLNALEKEEKIELEDISDYEREIFGEESVADEETKSIEET